ncbi:MAG: hypothetical protein WA950_12530 [Shinella sp.]|uniref:hypothetical protein n=1 Tax=Shinella sp. TaxID=1870904 RepID=UPI003C754D86
MSTLINIGPMIAKVIRDMLTEQGAILDVDSVYAQLIATKGVEVFQSERMLAEVAVRRKIKSHLKHAHSINSDDGIQLSLIKDDAPATLAVKQPEGGYAYVPLRLAALADLDAATHAKEENIKNARAALKRWEKTIKPIRELMEAENVTFGEAQKILSDRQAAKPPAKAKKKA